MHPRATLVLRLKGSGSDIGRHTVSLRWLNPSGNELWSSLGELDVGAAAPPQQMPTEMDLPLIAAIDLPLDEVGGYTMQIALDDQASREREAPGSHGRAGDARERNGELSLPTKDQGLRLTRRAPTNRAMSAITYASSVASSRSTAYAASAEREVHHARLAERNADVRYALVGAVTEEQQVGGQPARGRVPASSTDLGLLPRVARQADAVQPERGLREAGAVGAPGSTPPH